MGAPCITPWIQDSTIHPQAFGLIYHVSPYRFLDPRSSFCNLPPHLHELFEVFILLFLHPSSIQKSRSIPQNVHGLFERFNYSCSHRSPFILQAYRNPVASGRIRQISRFYTIKPCFGRSKFYKTPLWSFVIRLN